MVISIVAFIIYSALFIYFTMMGHLKARVIALASVAVFGLLEFFLDAALLKSTFVGALAAAVAYSATFAGLITYWRLQREESTTH